MTRARDLADYISTGVSDTELDVLDGVTAGTVTASKALVVDANKDIASVRNITVDGTITLEGATADAFETTLTVTDPTADNTITLPDASGTVPLIDSSGHLIVENADPELHLISTDGDESKLEIRQTSVTDFWDVSVDSGNSTTSSALSFKVDNTTTSFMNASGTTIYNDLDIEGTNAVTDPASLSITSGTGEAKLTVSSADPKIGIGTTSPAVSLDIATTDAIQVPDGTTAQRPSSPANGMFRYNTTDGAFEGYAGGAWGSVGGGGGSASYTAYESISAGDAVSLRTDGKIEKTAGAVQDEDLFVAGDETLIYSAGSPSPEQNTGDMLYIPGTNKVIWIFADDTNTKTKAQILSVSGTTITKVGTDQELSAKKAKNLCAAWDDSTTDKFVLTICSGADGDDGFAYVCTVSGDTISVGTEYNISTEMGVARSQEPQVVYDKGQDKFLITSRDISNDGDMIVATRSGTTLSFGSKVRYETATSQRMGLVYDESISRSLICYTNGDTLTAKSITISGTTPSVAHSDTDTTVSWNNGYTDSAQRMAGDKSGRFVWHGRERAVLITATTSAVTFQDVHEVTENDGTTLETVKHGSIVYDPNATTGGLAGAFAYVFPSETATETYFGFIYEASSNTLDNTAKPELTDTGGSYLRQSQALQYVPSQGSLVIAGTFDDLASSAAGVRFAADTTNATEFVGFAEAAIATDASGDVTIIGGTNDQQSSLTTGAIHYLTGGGGLSTTATDFPLGLAKSATEIQVEATAADFNRVTPLMTKISTTTVSSSVSNVNITLPTSGYTSLRLSFANVKNATNTVAAQIRLSADGGSSFKSLYYATRNINSSVSDSQSSGTTLTISNTALSNSANTFLFGFIDIYMPTERSTAIQFNVGYSQSGSNQTEGNFGLATMVGDDSQVIANYIRFQFGAGNFDKGVFTLYGIK